MRQWVLTLPHRLRYALAWDHRLCRLVLAVFIRAVLGFERRWAHRRGIPLAGSEQPADLDLTSLTLASLTLDAPFVRHRIQGSERLSGRSETWGYVTSGLYAGYPRPAAKK